MDVGIVALVVTAEGVEDGAGFLGGGGVIEVDERMPVDLLVENREILPQGLPIDGVAGDPVHAGMCGRGEEMANGECRTPND